MTHHPGAPLKNPRAPRPGADAAHSRLLTAAARLAETGAAHRLVVGILRGAGARDREQTHALRGHLAAHGITSRDLGPLPPEPDHRGTQPFPRPRVHLLLHDGDFRPLQALRLAAQWQLPLLSPYLPPGEEETGTVFRARRRAVMAAWRPGEARDIAVHRLTVYPVLPGAGRLSLDLDGEPLLPPAGAAAHLTLTPDGRLALRLGDDPRHRTADRIVCRAGSADFRLDLDGTHTTRLTGPLRVEALPGRLHLITP
ncbi:hypothetical protein [Streptomyces sp. YIM 98790]|uniref:hypothetical protein n=1 Tax=Streptomyces sp. YIM 98790 TaxID=2689077 RepID=UPI00140CD3A1|nr:hypothetical protein [Streptomyces sp. YIM 98790]